MALEDDIAILSQAPLFNLLEKDALRLVAFASETRSYREGDVLFKKGDRSDGGYVVTRGAIALDAAEDGSPAAFVAGPGALVALARRGRGLRFAPGLRGRFDQAARAAMNRFLLGRN